ncbi:MAG: hypothetical protein H0X62_07560 [Bacteroidetes bacterium]|nr:hypothetical protein [Bacteroidota bacterium]
MKKILPFFFLSLLWCCAFTKKQLKNSCYQTTKQYLVKNWNFNKSENYYIDKVDIVIFIAETECLKYLSKAEVIELFGTPSEASEHKLIYYIAPAEKKYEVNWHSVVFQFDDTKPTSKVCVLGGSLEQ